MSGKKFADAVKKYDRDQLFTPTEALAKVKAMATAKFDETVDIAVRLGVDPRKADQMVRGTVGLPSGTGKDVRVAVFAAGEAAQEARDAGADLVGADDLAAEIEKGNFNFDIAIATPDMMPLVGRLGPRPAILSRGGASSGSAFAPVPAWLGVCLRASDRRSAS